MGKFCPLRAIARGPVHAGNMGTSVLCLGSDCAMFIQTHDGKATSRRPTREQSHPPRDRQTRPPSGVCGLVGQGATYNRADTKQPDAFPDPAWKGELWKDPEAEEEKSK